MLELGLHTFAEVNLDANGQFLPHAQVVRNVIKEATLADIIGVHFFGVGEHHRADFAASTPEVVLAAIASVTSRLRLGSSATVLSLEDPVRVFERFATLDACSNGRAEVTVGRGWYTDAFVLFGHELSDYDTLFEDKLGLFAKLIRQHGVTWRGQTRPPLSNHRLFPPIEQGVLKTWVAVGATPNSVLRAARYDMPMMLAVIGGDPGRFRPFIELYHQAFEKLGKPAQAIGVHSTGYVADTDSQALEEVWPYYKQMRDQIGIERGLPPIERRQFDTEIDRGSLYVGSPETVARKIVTAAKSLSIARFNMKYSVGTLPHEKLLRSIELYGTKVIPLVHNMLSDC